MTTANATVRWGVIGSGGIARRRMIPEGIVAAKNCQLAAVYDVAQPVNEAVATQFGAVVCRSEAELLARPDVDVVYIATPAHEHCPQVIRAAQAGKHVLCEKPLGLTVAEGETMIQTCQEAGVRLGIDFMMRFHAYHQEARRLIRAGRLGTPVLGRAQLSCWYPPLPGAWRQDPALGGGGSLMDLGGHCIDLLEMMFGPVRRVSCLTGQVVHNYRSEDTAVVLLDFRNGAKGIVDNLFNVPDSASKNRLELYGSRGSILAENTIGQGEGGQMICHLSETDGDYQARQDRATTAGFPLTVPTVNTYRAQVEDFNRAVRTQGEPATNGQLGLWSQQVLLASYESARTGRAVELPDSPGCVEHQPKP